MDQEIYEALGLNSDATTADVVSAINTLKTEKASALNSAAHPDPDKFVPIGTHQLVVDKVKKLETAEADAREAAVNAELDAAIEAGKIAPADREFYATACNSEDGLAKFKSMVEARAPIVTAADPKKAPPTTASALNSEEQYAARQLGMTDDEYLAAKKEEA